MKFKITLLTLTLFASISTALFANKYKIEIEAPSYKNKTAELYKSINSKSGLIKSLEIDDKGYACFQDSLNGIEGGEYILKLDNNADIALLLTDDNPVDVKIKIDTDLLNSTIIGSRDTELLWSYVKEILPLYNQYGMLQRELQSGNRNVTDQDLSKISDEISKVQEKYLSSNKDTWFASYVSAQNQVDFESYVTDGMSDTEIRKVYQEHFFDNINFSEEKLFNTGYFTQLIDAYLTNIVVQNPDTIAEAACLLVEKAKENPRAQQAMLHYLFNSNYNSNVVGDENIWAKLFETYILGKDIPWMSPSSYYNVLNAYENLKLNRIGMTAQNLEVKQIDGSFINTNDVKAYYTILMFYSSTCGHCKNAITQLQEFLDNNNDLDIKVIAFITNGDEVEWKAFVQEHNMQNWINVQDFDFKSEYWLKYDARATPMIYLLNKDKKIISRRINVENLKKVLNSIK